MDICSSGVPIAATEIALVHSFGVGHGDCTLLELVQDQVIIFRMLVDGGKSVPPALLKHLRDFARPEGAKQIDVVVLTHIDHDHQGGLSELADTSVSIDEFWGPCLPAFRRLRGIFKARRISTALDNADMLERKLAAAGVRIVYPLEGYVHRFCQNKVVVSVVSPAARLIERLLSGNGPEFTDLLSQQPLPLEWLFGPDEESDLNANRFLRNDTLARPEDFDARTVPAVIVDAAELERAAEQAQGPHFEPNFFGNAVLNDTSLVLTVDFHLGQKHRRRVLLTGDQENWSYIAYKHPNGLGADVMKASHHGGRVYLADKGRDVVDQLYTWLRPRSVIVSAAGTYDLPTLAFRNALKVNGSTLLCPNVRNFEPLSAGATVVAGAKSCHSTFGCGEGGRAQREMMTITLAAGAQSANVPACLQGSGHSGSAPIAVLEQRVIEPDQSFSRWTHTEVEKYGRWISQQLDDRFKEITAHLESSATPYEDALEIAPVSWKELREQATVDGHFNLVASPQAVFAHGVAAGLFWSNVGRYFDEKSVAAFRSPSVKESKLLMSWLRSFDAIVVRAEKDPVQVMRAGNKFEVLECCEWMTFAAVLALKLNYPITVTVDLILPAVKKMLTTDYCSAAYQSDRESVGKMKWLVFTKTSSADGLPNELAQKFRASWEGCYEIHEGALRALMDDAAGMFAPCLVEGWRKNVYVGDSVRNDFIKALEMLEPGAGSGRLKVTELWRLAANPPQLDPSATLDPNASDNS